MHLIYWLVGTAGCLLGAWLWRGREQHWRDRLMVECTGAVKALEAERQTSLQAQAQQRALFESMAEGVLLLDRTGRISMANKSCRELLHLPGDLRGKTLLEAVRIPALSEMAAQLLQRQVFRNAELELPNSPARVVEVNASAVSDEHGNYDGAILVFHDLTRVKQLESTRRDFVANVSHELRTPLSLIKGFVETLLDGAKEDPGQTERFLRTIQKHTDRLTYLIEDLLTISKLESGPVTLNVEPVGLRDLAQRVIDDLRVKASERQIRIINQLDVHLHAVADADRLQQVFSNLVENAIKYGREAGSVLVNGTTSGTSEITVSVQDDGPGIPVEAQARVFERFYRVDRARSRDTGGTGLGLAIVKHIIQAHGGTVSVQSQPGRGTLFSFTLPRAVESRSPIALCQEALVTLPRGLTVGMALAPGTDAQTLQERNMQNGSHAAITMN